MEWTKEELEKARDIVMTTCLTKRTIPFSAAIELQCENTALRKALAENIATSRCLCVVPDVDGPCMYCRHVALLAPQPLDTFDAIDEALMADPQRNSTVSERPKIRTLNEMLLDPEIAAGVAREERILDLEAKLMKQAAKMGVLQFRAETAEAENAQLRAEIALVRGAMAAQDEREQLAGDRIGISWYESGCDWPDVVADRFLHLRAEIERKDAALIRLRDCDWVITLPDRMDAVRKIARDALAPPSERDTTTKEPNEDHTDVRVVRPVDRSVLGQEETNLVYLSVTDDRDCDYIDPRLREEADLIVKPSERDTQEETTHE